MTKTTLVLTYVWLGLAGLGALVFLVLAYGLATHDTSGSAMEAAVAALVLAVALAVLWVTPLTIAGVLTLRGRVWGWRLLMGHTGLGAIVWLVACKSAIPGALQAIRDRLIHGPHWGGYPEAPLMALGVLGLLAFSVFTVVALLRDNPDGWQP